MRSEFDLAVPKVGDIAAIVEIYTDPIWGYELECSDEGGITQWLLMFEPSEIEMEFV